MEARFQTERKQAEANNNHEVRKIAQLFYQVTAGKNLDAAKAEYTATKHELADLIRRLGTSKEQQQFEEQMGQDFAVAVSNNLEK